MGGSDILACGLFGFSSTNARNWNALTRFKFEVLGVEMDARGGDGCGIAYDNMVDKSEEIKKFDDFWRSDRIPALLEHSAIIGHDRKASVGSKSYDNTQPIFFPETTDPISNILAHNGTLCNHEELYKKHKAEAHFGLDISKMSDSQMLALLIERIGWQILNEYIGAAALLYMNANEPGITYVYHGESANRKGVTIKSEERPLFYTKDGENIWFCSTRSALEKIIMDKKSIEEVPTNKVFRVEGNTMTEIFTVNRDNCYQYEYVAPTTRTAWDDDYDYSGSYYGGGYYDAYGRYNKKEQKYNKQTQLQLPYAGTASKLSEVYALTKNADTIYWERGVMCVNGLALHGPVSINRTGFIGGDKTSVGYNVSRFTFYFWEGNLLKGRDEWIEALEFWDANCENMSPREIMQSIAVNFVLPFVIPETINGDDNVMYSTIVNPSTKICDRRYNGIILPLYSTKEILFVDGEVSKVTHSGKYVTIDAMMNYVDPFPEEYDAWEADYIDKQKKIECNIIKEESIINYECPECQGTGFHEREFCPTCKGDRVISEEAINVMFEALPDVLEYVNTISEEAKITIAITNMVEEGIFIYIFRLYLTIWFF